MLTFLSRALIIAMLVLFNVMMFAFFFSELPEGKHWNFFLSDKIVHKLSTELPTMRSFSWGLLRGMVWLLQLLRAACPAIARVE